MVKWKCTFDIHIATCNMPHVCPCERERARNNVEEKLSARPLLAWHCSSEEGCQCGVVVVLHFLDCMGRLGLDLHVHIDMA